MCRTVKEAIGIDADDVGLEEKQTPADTFHPAYYEDSCTAARGSEGVRQLSLKRSDACTDAVVGVDHSGWRSRSLLEVAVSLHTQTSSA